MFTKDDLKHALRVFEELKKDLPIRLKNAGMSGIDRINYSSMTDDKKEAVVLAFNTLQENGFIKNCSIEEEFGVIFTDPDVVLRARQIDKFLHKNRFALSSTVFKLDSYELDRELLKFRNFNLVKVDGKYYVEPEPDEEYI